MNTATPENTAQGKRGRKPTSKSRAAEIRTKLLATPLKWSRAQSRKKQEKPQNRTQ
jgi:hypothetical protein